MMAHNASGLIADPTSRSCVPRLGPTLRSAFTRYTRADIIRPVTCTNCVPFFPEAQHGANSPYTLSFETIWAAQGEQPHAGFPEANYHTNAERLARAGLRVVVIEQTETPVQLAVRNEERKKQGLPKVCSYELHLRCRVALTIADNSNAGRCPVRQLHKWWRSL